MPYVHTLGMDVVWDESKRKANLIKHHVDFADSVAALLDPLGRTMEDPDAEGEARFITFGEGFKGRILAVVWAEGDQHTIRIISARKASPGEARYFGRY